MLECARCKHPRIYPLDAARCEVVVVRRWRESSWGGRGMAVATTTERVLSHRQGLAARADTAPCDFAEHPGIRVAQVTAGTRGYGGHYRRAPIRSCTLRRSNSVLGVVVALRGNREIVPSSHAPRRWRPAA